MSRPRRILCSSQKLFLSDCLGALGLPQTTSATSEANNVQKLIPSVLGILDGVGDWHENVPDKLYFLSQTPWNPQKVFANSCVL